MRIQMADLPRAVILITVLCGVLGCGRTRGQSIPKHLEDKRQQYETIVANDPDNYSANSTLASIYTTYYVLYKEVSPDATKAQQFREKALLSTQKALQKAPMDGKAVLAVNLERLGEDRQALSIYKTFLAEAGGSVNSTNSEPDISPEIQRETRHAREVLILDIQLRVKELEDRLQVGKTKSDSGGQ